MCAATPGTCIGGRMPAGVLIESGQADLLLISYLGADFFNRGERVYRLLGCELTYEADLPAPGDTLRYEIHIDGHARQDEVRLFFFHYQCLLDGQPCIRVRNGQAGFFSDDDLAASAGVLWSAEDVEPARGRAPGSAARGLHADLLQSGPGASLRRGPALGVLR